MAWQTPKTNWRVSNDSSGNYAGDYFNYTDYNRIKNNLNYLYDLAVGLYGSFSLSSMGSDKKITDFVYTDEINLFENNLQTIIDNTYKGSYGTKKSYSANKAFITYTELNRIESATLSLYNNLTGQFNGRRRLQFRFGKRGAF